MKFEDLLLENGIQFRRAGEDKHSRDGWLQLTSTDMLPGFSLVTCTDSVIRHTQTASDLCALVKPRSTNHPNVFKRKHDTLMRRVALNGPPRTGSVSHSILCILQARSPNKVLQTIVGRNAIQMTAFETIRARPHKCQKNQIMNEEAFAGTSDSGPQPDTVMNHPLRHFQRALLPSKPTGSIMAANPDRSVISDAMSGESEKIKRPVFRHDAGSRITMPILQ